MKTHIIKNAENLLKNYKKVKIMSFKKEIKRIEEDGNNASWEKDYLKMGKIKELDKTLVTLSLFYLKKVLEDKKIKMSHLIMKNNSSSLAASLYYLSAKKMKKPITLDECSVIFNVERKQIARGYNQLKKFWGIKYCKGDEELFSGRKGCIYNLKTDIYIKKFIRKLNLTNKEKKDCITLSKRVDEQTHFMESPLSLVGAIIYISTHYPENRKIYTQRDIADIVGITEVTIRNSVIKILSLFNLKIDNISHTVVRYVDNLNNAKKELENLTKKYKHNKYFIVKIDSSYGLFRDTPKMREKIK